MDTPYRVPDPLIDWLDVVAAPRGSRLTQGSCALYRGEAMVSLQGVTWQCPCCTTSTSAMCRSVELEGTTGSLVQHLD